MGGLYTGSFISSIMGFIFFKISFDTLLTIKAELGIRDALYLFTVGSSDDGKPSSFAITENERSKYPFLVRYIFLGTGSPSKI